MEYHKIQSVYKRSPDGKVFLIGEWSLPEFEYLQNNVWVWTEKVDGTNIRVMWDGETLELKFGGKTDNAQIPTFLYDRLNVLFPKEKFYGRQTMCLYGEGFGAKIQKGGGNYISKGVDFVLFDVKIEEWWLNRDSVECLAKELYIQIVPIIGEGTLNEAIEKVKNGFLSQWGNFTAEGLVMRPKVELKARSGKRIITKVKHKDFK